MPEWYVYELVDPRTNSVFYVGKGKGSRIDHHEVDAAKGRVSRKCDTIRDIKSLGHSILKRKVRLFSDEQAAYDFERQHIDSFGLDALTNVMPGGGYPRSVVPQGKMSDAQTVSIMARVMRQTGGSANATMTFAGGRFDISDFVMKMLVKVSVIIQSHGQEWSDKQTLKYGIKFSVVGSNLDLNRMREAHDGPRY